MVYLIFIALSINPTLISEADSSEILAIWNVGQGQWVTVRTLDECLHFDVGGEHFSFLNIKNFCGNRTHKIFISHADWDHINFLKYFRNEQIKSCIAIAPSEPKIKPYKLKSLQHFKKCPINTFNNEVSLLNPIKNCSTKAKSNCYSHIFDYKGKIFISGDSFKKSEHESRGRKKYSYLILGHHGSQTSSSEKFISTFKDTIAIASARKRKYNHPHPEILKRLKKYKTPLLTTEKWGHIFIYL